MTAKEFRLHPDELVHIGVFGTWDVHDCREAEGVVDRGVLG